MYNYQEKEYKAAFVILFVGIIMGAAIVLLIWRHMDNNTIDGSVEYEKTIASLHDKIDNVTHERDSLQVLANKKDSSYVKIEKHWYPKIIHDLNMSDDSALSLFRANVHGTDSIY